MVEHLLCKQGGVGSIPSASTSLVSRRAVEAAGDCHGKAERSGGILRGVACCDVHCQCEEVGAFLFVAMIGLSDPMIVAMRTGASREGRVCSG